MKSIFDVKHSKIVQAERKDKPIPYCGIWERYLYSQMVEDK